MSRTGSNHKGGNSGGTIGKIVTATELAAIVGTSRQTIASYAKAGMPVYDRSGTRGSPRYDSAACIAWITDRKLKKHVGSDDADEMDIDEIYRQTALTKLKREEIQLALDEERYGDIDAVIEDVGLALSEIRAGLISLPTLSAQLEHQDQLTIEKKLTDKVDRMLEELSDFHVEESEL